MRRDDEPAVGLLALAVGLDVVTRSRRYSWTTLRSSALIASSATGRPCRSAASAAWSASARSAAARRSR